jgi:hypothetical protein
MSTGTSENPVTPTTTPARSDTNTRLAAVSTSVQALTGTGTPDSTKIAETRTVVGTAGAMTATCNNVPASSGGGSIVKIQLDSYAPITGADLKAVGIPSNRVGVVAESNSPAFQVKTNTYVPGNNSAVIISGTVPTVIGTAKAKPLAVNCEPAQ